VQVIKELPPEPKEQCVVALGNFDGVHLGHQRLLESGLEKAAQLGVKLAVLLFEPHPLKFLFPERSIGFLTTQEERIKAFSHIGVDTVYLLPFNREMAETSPEKFVKEILVRMGVAHIVVGFNYSFGALGKGTPEDLQRYGNEFGFGVSVLQAQMIDGKIISSTAIRKALQQGDVEQAKRLLGRAHCLCGKVVEGEKRGRELGYPTANLSIADDLLIPKRGVYAVWVEIDGAVIQGMMNIGMKPTFHSEYHLTIEVHFFNFSGDLYGRELMVHIEERLRDERKFSSLRELKEQLERDEINAKKALKFEESFSDSMN
jgi:riboflavin kinase / FMN adenylyltransferase